MPPKGQADQAHPQAADWVMGTLGPAETAGFRLHLTGCPHCQAAVEEFGELGQTLRHLPPAAEPPPGLEARTIASVLAAAAQDRTPAHVRHVPKSSPAAAETSSSTQLIDGLPGALETGTQEGPAGAGAKIIRFPRWHGRAGLLAIASAAAAAIIAAVVILPRLNGGPPAGGATFALRSPSGQAASGVATDRPDASGSWDVTLSVAHLKNPGEVQIYQCWYVGPGRPGHRQLVSAGTFVVGDNGSGTFSMTSGADPHQFRTMEVTIEHLGDASQPGAVILTGTAHFS